MAKIDLVYSCDSEVDFLLTTLWEKIVNEGHKKPDDETKKLAKEFLQNAFDEGRNIQRQLDSGIKHRS